MNSKRLCAITLVALYHLVGCVSMGASSPPQLSDAEAQAVAGKSLRIIAVDEQGQPVEGAQVGLQPPMVGQESTVLAVTDSSGAAEFAASTLFSAGAPSTRLVFVTDWRNRRVTILPVTPAELIWPLSAVVEAPLEVQVTVSDKHLRKAGRELTQATVKLLTLRHVGEDKTHFPAVQQYEKHQLAAVSGSELTFLLPRSDKDRYEFGCGAPGAYDQWAVVKASARRVKLEFAPQPHPFVDLVGRPAPELHQIKGWKNGGPVTLAELRGKVVILDFWGYWCGPCIASMPKLMELHEKYAKRGLVIIAIHDDSVGSIEEMDARLRSARINQWGGRDLPFLVALDGGGQTRIAGTDKTTRGATTAAYGVTAFPTSVLIDRNGSIIKKFHPHTFDSNELEQLLGSPAAVSAATR